MKLALGLRVVDFQRILNRSKHTAGWLELAEDWLEIKRRMPFLISRALFPVVHQSN